MAYFHNRSDDSSNVVDVYVNVNFRLRKRKKIRLHRHKCVHTDIFFANITCRNRCVYTRDGHNDRQNSILSGVLAVCDRESKDSFCLVPLFPPRHPGNLCPIPLLSQERTGPEAQLYICQMGDTPPELTAFTTQKAENQTVPKGEHILWK